MQHYRSQDLLMRIESCIEVADTSINSWSGQTDRARHHAQESMTLLRHNSYRVRSCRCVFIGTCADDRHLPSKQR